jgi:hypothetical protein
VNISFDKINDGSELSHSEIDFLELFIFENLTITSMPKGEKSAASSDKEGIFDEISYLHF